MGKQDTLNLVEAANHLLLEGEPHNISIDTYSGFTGYKPQYIIDAMNQTFGIGQWGFEEISSDLEPVDKGGLIVSQVKVWLAGVEGQPTGWGQARITKGDLGDARKGAQTDAIKKALSYFSIGNRAYQGLLSADKPAQRPQGNSGRVQNGTPQSTNNRVAASVASSQSAKPARQNVTNLSDIPTASKLREIAKSLKIEWNTVLAEAFEKPITDGKVTLEALIAKGSELPPGYCQRIAAYLQAKQAA